MYMDLSATDMDHSMHPESCLKTLCKACELQLCRGKAKSVEEYKCSDDSPALKISTVVRMILISTQPTTATAREMSCTSVNVP